ncbi:MAG: ABC transporter ATP-binding protein [Candidatus Velthaea sp.]
MSGVSKSYGARSETTLAVSDITLEVRANEFVALIGPSGCGKSTVLNMVAGLAEADAGAIEIDGVSVAGPGPDRGVVFQNYALLPWMTVRENLAFALESARGMRDRVAIDAAIDRILATVHLSHAAARYPRALSGGMKQRVGFARALLIEPKIVLLDEPFGALDALTRAHLQDEVLSLMERTPLTALMVTHDIDEALLLADRVAIMSRGPGAVIARVIDVPFARPRRRSELMESREFNHLRAELLAHLTHETELVERASLAV